MEHPSKLIDSNIIGKLTYLPSLMGLEIASCDVTIVRSIYSSDLYIISRTRTKSTADRALAEVHRAKKSLSWWTGFDEDYPHCKSDLEAKGWVSNGIEVGMFAEIEKISRPQVREDLQILSLSDKKKLDDFLEVQRQRSPHSARSLTSFYTGAAPYLFSPEAPLKMFIEYAQNKPVATSAAFLDAKTVGIWNVVTLAAFRRRGIGTAMALHALFSVSDSSDRRIGVLVATKEGRSIYEKVGFQKVKDFSFFNKGRFFEQNIKNDPLIDFPLFQRQGIR
jgi:ribosomal protein S18 acetylase RimI-like enzyme